MEWSQSFASGSITEIRGAKEIVHSYEYILDLPWEKLALARDFNLHDLADSLEALPDKELVVYRGFVRRQQVTHVLGHEIKA